LGHDGPPVGGWWEKNLITDELLTLCPRRLMLLAPPGVVDEMLRYVNSYYPAYQDGHLLVAGGLADQPARYVSLVQLTRRYDAQVQEKFDELTREEEE
jgi:hypothetical protein